MIDALIGSVAGHPTALFANEATADISIILVELGTIFVGLAVLGRVAHRVGLSPIPLYLLTGLLLHDGGLLDLQATDAFVAIGAQVGVVLLLLLLGLEYGPEELVGTLKASAPAGAVDLVCNFTPGVAVGLLLGWSPLAAVFLGGITYVSSSGVIAKVLGDLRRLGNRETPTILAVLVMEDLAMAVYLPVVAGLAVGGAIAGTALSVIAAMVIVGLAIWGAVRYSTLLDRVLFNRSDEVLLFSLLGLTLLIAGGAEKIHISAAVGAFLVGIAIGGPSAHRGATLLAPLRDLFAGLFFVYFTFQIEPSEIVDALPVAFALAVVTGATKMFTGWWAAGRSGIATRGRIRAGTMLMARGEFSIVIAGLATLSGVEAGLGALATSYVLILAIVGPVVTRYSDVITARFERKPAAT